MDIQPAFSDRAVRSYACIQLKARRDQLPDVVPRTLGELFGFLNEQHIAPSGAPLVRYRTVDYRTGEVDIDVGVPVQGPEPTRNARVRINELPAGRFAIVTHQGHYDGLVETTAALLDWGKHSGVVWDASQDGELTTWGARVEHYLIGPPDEQDAEKWRTEIAIQLAEGPGAA